MYDKVLRSLCGSAPVVLLKRVSDVRIVSGAPDNRRSQLYYCDLFLFPGAVADMLADICTVMPFYQRELFAHLQTRPLPLFAP